MKRMKPEKVYGWPKPKVYYGFLRCGDFIMFTEDGHPINVAEEFHEAPPGIAAWFHKIMEDNE